MSAWVHIIFLTVLNLYFALGSKTDVLKYIGKYFGINNITQLHIFLCREEDGIFLRKHPPFSNFLSRISVKRLGNWSEYQLTPSGFFIDFSCEYNKHIFTEVPDVLLTSGFSWLANGSAEVVLPLLKEAPVGLSTELALLLPNQTLLEIYRSHVTSNLSIRKCENPNGRPCPVMKTRFNLEGVTLRASVVNFLHVKDDEEGKHQFDILVRDKGFEPPKELFIHKYYILNHHLGYLFNFNISLVLADTYGYKTANGTYNGQIYLLNNEIADIAITPMAMVPERVSLLDYTVDMERATFIFVFLEERSIGGVTALIVPFSISVWVVIVLISTLAISTSCLIFYSYHPQNIISEGFLNVIGVMSAQGVLEMNVTSSRVLNFFLLTLGLLLATYYNAAIMNGLLSPAPAQIKDVKDVLNSRKIGISNITYIHPLYFHPLLIKKLKEYKEYPIYEISEGVQRLKKGDFALVGDGKVMYTEMDQTFTDSEKCSTRRMPMSITLAVSCCNKKYSHYTEMLKVGSAWLRESGLSHREKKFWYPDPPHCLRGTAFKPVSIKAIAVAFCIYVTGFVLSLIALFFEIRHFRGKLRKPKKCVPQGFLK